MAKINVGKGLKEYTKQLTQLYDVSRTAIGQTIYQGAAVVAAAMVSEIRGLPKDSCSPIEKADLIDGFGIARMQERNDFYNVKLGFDGYNRIKTKKFPSGQPNAMIARSIVSGTSFRQKNDFVGRATRKSLSEAEEKMRAEFDKQLKALWPDS